MISYKDIFRAVVEDVQDSRTMWILMGTKTLIDIKKQRWIILYEKSLSYKNKTDCEIVQHKSSSTSKSNA